MEVFPFLRMDGVQFMAAEATPPWGVSFGVLDAHRLYVVRSGSCWFEAWGDTPLRISLGTGDLLGVRSGVRHSLRDSPSTEIAEATRGLAVRALSDRPPHRAAGTATALLIGSVPRSVEPLIQLLPTLIHVPRQATESNRRLERLLALIEEELAARAGELGTQSVVRRLSEVLVVEMIRFVATTMGGSNPAWRHGMADPEIAKAVASLHADPARPWTLRDMARLAALSRTAFEARFRRFIGDSPRRYLVRIRMQRAGSALRLRRQSVAEIAASVGYASPAAFHRAFFREFRMTPRAYQALADREGPGRRGAASPGPRRRRRAPHRG